MAAGAEVGAGCSWWRCPALTPRVLLGFADVRVFAGARVAGCSSSDVMFSPLSHSRDARWRRADHFR